MDEQRWRFRLEDPVEQDGGWHIAYLLMPPGTLEADANRIPITKTYPCAEAAVQDGTRLAGIHVADLNGEAPALEPPAAGVAGIGRGD
ncbi:hypothetical protein [Bordetella sp. 2513F-2]